MSAYKRKCGSMHPFFVGLLAFSDPEFIQPPYTFPNPRWPEQRDASFIAPFYAEQTFQYIGERGISNVWYRLVFRPRAFETVDEWGNKLMNPTDEFGDMFQTPRDRYKKHQWGRRGIIGANGFRADYAVIVTWERMAYGGAPKITQVNRYEEAKRWTNTYQVVLATDEIRSYVIFNYAHINWTSSNTAGALQGRGGLQSAMAGFNAGNGTGWTSLPYSGEGRVLKLQEFSNVGVPGRWLYRVDEQIINGGCSNESIGKFHDHSTYCSFYDRRYIMNVSGPCLRAGDVVKVIFDEYQVDCVRLNMIRAQCVLPVNRMFKTGLVNTKFSRDGGQSYPYVGTFYLLQPSLASPQVKLIDNPREFYNNWRSHNATRLRLEWAPNNLTMDINSMVDIKLYGYWEDTDDHIFEDVVNFSIITFSVFWSKMTPFGWYFRDVWEYEYGKDWALELCQDWFDYDGKRVNYAMDLEPTIPCPCTLDQALLDMGRFMPLYGCDRDGDASCEYNKGAQHCVMSNAATWTGAGQVCCYDFEGWLMHRTSHRSHPMGSYPFKRPPYVPSLSNYHTDLMAYEKCYVGLHRIYPPVAGIAYGDPHFITYDGTRYSFQGKGYYVLTMSKDPRHDFNVQVRMEQPPNTDWNQPVHASVITGVAGRENQSDIVQLFARKDHRRWRYRMDVIVNGHPCYFDTPELKMQRFRGVTLRSPERNHNQSEIQVMFDSGAGMQVMEAHGVLSVMVLLPPDSTNPLLFPVEQIILVLVVMNMGEARGIFVTVGLLGTFNDNHLDDLMTPEGGITMLNHPF
uniref:AMOP domain protein n=1 Tax=Ditylenchus dipsaci TaxID=166011 RepID=A0A915DYD5_9BILA